jgi:hypothetical protein
MYPPIFLRGVMRLVNLYAGDEKNLDFAPDVAALMSHFEEIQQSERYKAVKEIAFGVNGVTVASGGRSLSDDGIRGIQQLVCKVNPILNYTEIHRV